jgi:hypothetical protein
LEGGKYLVTADVVSCGSKAMVECSYHNTWIDADVVAALGNNPTVGGLLDLANRALAGENVGVSLTSIASLVDAINNAFDGCRLFVRYSDSTVQCDVSLVAAPRTQSLEKTFSVTAYPNPFSNKVRFIIQSPKAGRATLEVYNMLGQRMATLFEGQLSANETRNVDFNAPVNHRTNLIYMLRMNGEQISGKLMSTKQ